MTTFPNPFELSAWIASPSDPQVALGVFWPFVRLFSGTRAAQVKLSTVGIDAESFGQPTTRVPHRLAMGLLQEIVTGCGEPTCGLRAGQMTEAGDFGGVEHAARHAEDLGGAFRHVARFSRLLHDALETTVLAEGDDAAWCLRMNARKTVPSAANDFLVSAALSFVNRNAAVVEPPVAIWLMHPEPAYSSSYARVFGAPVHFDMPWNAIVMPRERLAAKTRTPSGRLATAFGLEARRQLGKVERSDALSAYVRRAVLRELGVSTATMDGAALHLAMTVRALRRRLRAEGETFEGLLDRLRLQLAELHLRESTHSIGDIAAALGFGNAMAFHVAFDAWAGMPPSQYRAKNRSAWLAFRAASAEGAEVPEIRTGT